jgi:hypothetical protein
VESGKLDIDRVRQHARKALDAAMPLVQQAIAAEMKYGEAELFAPLPWWDALGAGVYAFNRKRLGLHMALVQGKTDKLDNIEAVAEFLPEQQAYDVQLLERDSGALLNRVQWLLVPDLGPSRVQAWVDLSECLRQAGIALREQQAKYH